MTYRERREARADRLRGWADKREQKSAAGFERARKIADGIPLGQPILVGHHSESHHRRDIARIASSATHGRVKRTEVGKSFGCLKENKLQP